MKSWPHFSPFASASAVGEYLAENGFQLAEVLEWYAGKRCNSWNDEFHNRQSCHYCYMEPHPVYGRDVVCAFINNGGLTHPRQVEIADRVSRSPIALFNGPLGDFSVPVSREAMLGFKIAVLCAFSGPVKDMKCNACDTFPYTPPDGCQWILPNCKVCGNTRILPGGGVRIRREASFALNTLVILQRQDNARVFISDHLGACGFLNWIPYESREDKREGKLYCWQEIRPDQLIPLYGRSSLRDTYDQWRIPYEGRWPYGGTNMFEATWAEQSDIALQESYKSWLKNTIPESWSE